ncbi:hypothetical protein K4H00_23315, partial [Mycobacterium tuberculosis]|nr:hypothetical protein [Mycobacterium tuberculosis]
MERALAGLGGRVAGGAPGRGGGQVAAQQAFQPEDGGGAGHQQAAVGTPGGRVLDHVRVLVLDIADH